MSQQPTQGGGSSRFVQGCLFSAVSIFVILLVAMIILAYIRFQDVTSAPSSRPGPQTQAAPPSAP